MNRIYPSRVRNFEITFILSASTGVRILPTKSSRFKPLNPLAGAPVCDRLLALPNPKAGCKPALRFVGRCRNKNAADHQLFRVGHPLRNSK